MVLLYNLTVHVYFCFCLFTKNFNLNVNEFFSLFCSHRVSVTFFNEFGESFEKTFKEIGEEQVVLIIACAKVNKFDGKFSLFMFYCNVIFFCYFEESVLTFITGEIGLTNFPATRYYLKPNHYSVKELHQRYCQIMVHTKFLQLLYINVCYFCLLL